MWTAAGVVLALVALVLVVQRSSRLRELLRLALAAAKVQAQPAAVARWGGPLGRGARRGRRRGERRRSPGGRERRRARCGP